MQIIKVQVKAGNTIIDQFAFDTTNKRVKRDGITNAAHSIAAERGAVRTDFIKIIR